MSRRSRVPRSVPEDTGRIQVTFQQLDDLRRTALDDAHEARAQELDLLQDAKRAAWMRGCSNPASPFSRQTCKQRYCPTCARNLASKYTRLVRGRIRQMATPRLFLLTRVTTGPFDLATTIGEFRAWFGRLRRRKCFAGVRSGVGAMEFEVTKDKTRWLVHAHLVLDVEQCDARDVDVIRKKLTDGRGTFSLNPERPDVAADHDALDRYITKPDTWCPPPGSMHLKQFEILRWAVRRPEDPRGVGLPQRASARVGALRSARRLGRTCGRRRDLRKTATTSDRAVATLGELPAYDGIPRGG
jgi:hypothetical protein